MNAGGALNFRCPVGGCARKKDEVWHLACAFHWNRLPKPVRDEVWRLFREEHDTLAHRTACFQAIELLNKEHDR